MSLITTRTVTVTVPNDHVFEAASKALGIAGMSANKLINAAIRVYKGENQEQVKASIAPKESNLHGTRKNAQVEAELLAGIDNAAHAARVGLGMFLGMSREEAEKWAASVSQ
jgi:hypothetical protein